MRTKLTWKASIFRFKTSNKKDKYIKFEPPNEQTNRLKYSFVPDNERMHDSVLPSISHDDNSSNRGILNIVTEDELTVRLMDLDDVNLENAILRDMTQCEDLFNEIGRLGL